MSNTPRTDGLTILAQLGMIPACNIVPAAFARQLERELDSSNTVSATLLVTKCRELAEVTKQLHHAVGLLSTMPQFENQHPEDILISLKGGAQ